MQFLTSEIPNTDIVPALADTFPNVIARSHSADVARQEERDIQKEVWCSHCFRLLSLVFSQNEHISARWRLVSSFGNTIAAVENMEDSLLCR